MDGYAAPTRAVATAAAAATASEPPVQSSLLLGRTKRRSTAVAPPPPRSAVVATAKKGGGGESGSKGFGKPPPAPKQQLPVCECGSGKPFKRCCEPALIGQQAAPTAEATLRARFSAFKLGNEEYIYMTTHPDYLPFHYEGKAAEEATAQYKEDIHTGCTKYDYTDFSVVKVEAGDNENESFVAFSYKSSPKPEPGSDQMPDWKTTNERALMLRTAGKWQFKEYQRFEFSMNDLMQGTLERAERERAEAQAATGAGSTLPGTAQPKGLPQVPAPRLGRARAAITPKAAAAQPAAGKPVAAEPPAAKPPATDSPAAPAAPAAPSAAAPSVLGAKNGRAVKIESGRGNITIDPYGSSD